MTERGEKFVVMVADSEMRSLTDRILSQIEIDSTTLSTNLNVFIAQIDGVLSKAPDTVGGFGLTEVEISVEISADGQVVLWGVGGQVGGKGGISLTFKREGS